MRDIFRLSYVLKRTYERSLLLELKHTQKINWQVAF